MSDLGEILTLVCGYAPRLRDAGVTSVTLPDGISFTLARGDAPAPKADEAPEEKNEIDESQREEKAMRARWEAYWERMTRSSGAPVPPFPGREKFARVARALGMQ